MTPQPHAAMPYFAEALEQAGVVASPAGGKLYHYASPDGLLGILADGGIRATNAEFFRDTSEYTYGLSLLKNDLHRFNDAGLGTVSAWIDRYLVDRSGYEVFASCFCEDGDSLPLWREFAGGGAGYSIGFNADDLSHDGAFPLLAVRYGDADVSRAYQRMIEWAISRLEPFRILGAEELEPHMLGILTSFVAVAFLLTVSSKKLMFAHEREWRLIHLSNRANPIAPNQVSLRCSDGVMIPYVLFHLPASTSGQLAIDSISCGPLVRDDRAMNGMQAVVQKYGLSNVALSRSAALGVV